MKEQQHPEQQAGEVFVGNIGDEDSFKSQWLTRRMGHTAYATDGLPMRGMKPMFVQASEMAAYQTLEDWGEEWAGKISDALKAKEEGEQQ